MRWSKIDIFSKFSYFFSKRKKVIRELKIHIHLVKRIDKLNEIKEILASSQPTCIVIEGKAGVGKSFFLQTLVEDLKEDHFIIFRKIEHSENEKMVFVLGELAFKLEADIRTYVHWSAKEEIVIEATESMLKWAKNVLKIPEEIPVEKIPSYLSGIDKEQYERSFIQEFKDTLNNLIKHIPPDKRMIIILDQVERIDSNDHNLLYDLMEGIPERTLFILATKKPILTAEIIAKVNLELLEIQNFTEKETVEMLRLNGILYDENFVKKFYLKYKGFPLLQGMALNYMKLKRNYDLDELPENLECYFKELYKTISPTDLGIIWILSIIRECVGVNELCNTTKKELPDILSVLRKKEISNVVKANHCYELFHSLFSEFVQSEFEKTTRDQFENIHEIAAEYYFNKLQKSHEINPDELVSAMIEAPYHASKAKSLKLLELIEYSIQFKKMWGYLDEAKEELVTAYDLYQKNKDKKGMSYMLNELGVLYFGWGKPEQALEYFQKAVAIDEELNDIRGKATMLNNIGALYRDWSKPEQALEYFQKALAIAEELNDIQGKATRLNNIGALYRDWGKPEQALEYFQKALAIDEELNDML